MDKPTLLIVEDSESTRKRIETAIIDGDRFEVVGSVGDFSSAYDILINTSPNVLLTDLDLPDGNGLDLIKLLHLPEVKTQLAIVISIFADGKHVIDALKAGASGYLLKDDDYIEINDAISQMLNGGAPISPSIARYLLDELTLSPVKKLTASLKKHLLTKREREVLILVSKGYTAREIAELLDISIHTVKGYSSAIYKKLAVNNKMQAVHEATAQGII